ncbi:MAG: TolC family protein [Deltaproteobacteria bacterium]|nr:TolC family protein [Deltaproteobacteria bacterium]
MSTSAGLGWQTGGSGTGRRWRGCSILLWLLMPSLAAAQPAGERTEVAGEADAAAAVEPLEPLEQPLREATPGPPLTLEEAFELARARHPSLRGVREELEKADAMLAQAWGALLPRVSGQIMYTLNDEPTTVSFGGMSITIRQQHIAQAQLSIQAPLFNMPILSAIDTARLGRSMAGLAEEEGARQLLLGVATAFYGSLSARELVEVQADAFEKAKGRVRAAQARLDAGAGIRIDVARARLELETARLAHEAALLGLDNARQALAGLLVMDELPVPLVPETNPEAPATAEELVERAAADRSDVELKRLQIALAEQNLESAWAAFYPSLALAWQLQSELTEPAGFGGRRNAWALVFVLSIPIYDQSRYGLLDQRRAEIRQAESNLEASLLALDTEIQSAFRSYESSLTTIDTAVRQVELAEEALGLAEAGFQAGAATSLDVDDAQQRVNQARINLAVQRYQSRLALLKLAFLAGEVPGGE